MTADRRAEGRRGLLAVMILLVLFALAVDLLRSDSAVRGFFREMGDPSRTPLERVLDGVLP